MTTTKQPYEESDMACRGAVTRQVPGCGADFAECVACKDSVRWDLADHHFFGFQNCKHAKPEGEQP